MTNPAVHDWAVQLLTERLLTNAVRPSVLFDPGALGDAIVESDIDLLVIYDGSFATKERFTDVADDVDLANGVLTQLIFFRTKGFEREIRWRSYFSQDVINQGVVLYDDGICQGICRESLKAGSGRVFER